MRVARLVDFGAFVEFVPGKDSLLHVSEIAWERVENPSDVLKEGDIIEVKYLGIDPKTKKTRVSRKALLPRPENFEKRERPHDKERPHTDKERKDKPHFKKDKK